MTTTRPDRLTDEAVLESHNDREMILRPWLWPSHPILHLKRRDPTGQTFGDHGYLRDRAPDMPKHRISPSAAITVILDSTLGLHYPDVDALLNAGWLVD